MEAITLRAASAEALSLLSAIFLSAGRAGLPMETNAARELSLRLSCRSAILPVRVSTQLLMAGSILGAASGLAATELDPELPDEDELPVVAVAAGGGGTGLGGCGAAGGWA